MTIYTSNLPNDQDMIAALGGIAIPLPLFTDACFAGIGGDSASVLVAIECKKVGDLAQCINDGRLLLQLQSSRENGADILVVIVEGRCRRNPDDGLLEVPVWGINPRTMHRAELWQPVRPTMQFSRFRQYLFELEYLVGVYVIQTENVEGTADVIQALWSWFQRSEHQSLKAIYKRPPPSVQLGRPSLVRRVAAELDGIGWAWSAVAASRFRTVHEMVGSDVEAWAELEVVSESGKRRRLGRKVAEKVVRAIRGEGN